MTEIVCSILNILYKFKLFVCKIFYIIDIKHGVTIMGFYLKVSINYLNLSKIIINYYAWNYINQHLIYNLLDNEIIRLNM